MRIRTGQPGAMGTTCTVAVVMGQTVHLSHIGDTRAYLLREGECVDSRMTISAYEVARRAGEDPDPELKSCLLRAIGPFDESTPDFASFEWAESDIIIVCCDGVWEFVSGGRLVQYVRGNVSMRHGCHTAVRKAIGKKTDDNATGCCDAAIGRKREMCCQQPTRPPPVHNKKLFWTNVFLVLGLWPRSCLSSSSIAQIRKDERGRPRVQRCRHVQ